eukprot:Phypoly_transcript_20275.p1 GENE.Phypoly_transcript_20275~~Phypoly_transcript_20275.p1  ORF type:complete len:225 (+),score=29.89 Phypoly_transcript_20275:97-675(+)
MTDNEKTAIIKDGRKKIHQVLPSGEEMIEEFDIVTDELLVRRVRKATVIGGQGPWEYEIGEEAQKRGDPPDIKESSVNPILIRKDTPDFFQWRIRNLPYPKDVYSISVEKDTSQIVLRTSNKKYFKKIKIPDMQRANIALEDNSISFTHANNTLIISYKKPPAILAIESARKKERATIKITKESDAENCKTQ